MLIYERPYKPCANVTGMINKILPEHHYFLCTDVETGKEHVICPWTFGYSSLVHERSMSDKEFEEYVQSLIGKILYFEDCVIANYNGNEFLIPNLIKRLY